MAIISNDMIVADEIPIIPIGAIIIWNGTVDNIPASWQLCDGTNGTPDLRGRFILGSSYSHAVGSTGGSETVTLTVDQMPSHSHYVSASEYAPNLGQGELGRVNDGTPIDVTSANTGRNKPHNNMPPYYTLCYIMKIA